ncbi:hypothetical protein BH11BAC5_BH11BAC5_53220 [soil metagenome]
MKGLKKVDIKKINPIKRAMKEKKAMQFPLLALGLIASKSWCLG